MRSIYFEAGHGLARTLGDSTISAHGVYHFSLLDVARAGKKKNYRYMVKSAK
jgi:hypothetical protein